MPPCIVADDEHHQHLRLTVMMRPVDLDGVHDVAAPDDDVAAAGDDAAVDDDDAAGDDYELSVAMAYYGHCVANAMCAAGPLDGHDDAAHDPVRPLVGSVEYA